MILEESMNNLDSNSGIKRKSAHLQVTDAKVFSLIMQGRTESYYKGWYQSPGKKLRPAV